MSPRLHSALVRLGAGLAVWLLLVAGYALWLVVATADEPGRAGLPITDADSIGLPIVGFAALAAGVVVAVGLALLLVRAVRAPRPTRPTRESGRAPGSPR